MLKIRKLPFKNPDGSVNPNGLKAAVAAIHGARSGKPMNVPGAMKKLRPYIEAVNAWRKKKRGLEDETDFLDEIAESLIYDIEEIPDIDRKFYEITPEEVSQMDQDDKMKDGITNPDGDGEKPEDISTPKLQDDENSDLAKKLEEQKEQVDKLLAANEAAIKQNEEMVKRLKELEEDKEAKDFIIFSQRVDKDCDKLLNEEKHHPAMVNIAKSILLGTKGKAGEITVKLTEGSGDDAKEVDKNLHDAIISLMDALPKECRVDTEEKSHSSKETDEIRKHGETELSDKEVADYAKENQITYEDALVKLAEQGKAGDLGETP